MWRELQCLAVGFVVAHLPSVHRSIVLKPDTRAEAAVGDVDEIAGQ